MSVCLKFYLLLLSVLFQVIIYYVGINIKISISHFAEKEYLCLTVWQLLEEMNIAKLKSLVITYFFFIHIYSSVSHAERYMYSYIFSNMKWGYRGKVIKSNQKVIMITFVK